MDLATQGKKNRLMVALFLSATAVVLVCLLGFVLALWDVMTVLILLLVTVLLTVTLWLMLRLDKQADKHSMNQESPEETEMPKKPDEVLSPEAAREWLDDFLVKQQAEDDLPPGL